MSSWKIVALLVGGLLFVFVGSAVVGAGLQIAGLFAPQEGSEGEEGSKDAEEATDTPRPGRNRGGSGESTARVTRVIDGDTVVLTRFGRTRLIGINTPEQGRCHEHAATRFTKRRLEGRLVRYELGVERRDRYGRTLAYLYRGGMHNLALVKKGYAVPLIIPPNDKYASRFVAAQRRARNRREGRRSGACERKRARERPRAGRRAKRRRLTAPVPKRSNRPKRRAGGGLPPPPPDLNCSDVSGSVRVGPSDPHRLDADGDGVGCE